MGQNIEGRNKNTGNCARKRIRRRTAGGKKAEKVRRESEVWEIVNRERKGRKRVNKGIERRD